MTTILVVDDDPQIRRLLRLVLEKAGYGVEEAPDGRQALKVFCKQPPDLVITDIVMPEKEGIETILEMKRCDPAIPIIAISGGGSLNPVTYLDVARSMGVSATMTKPIDTGRLTTTVKALLNAPASAPPTESNA